MTKPVAGKLFLFDLDGTIYLSGRLLPGVTRFLDRLDEAQVSYAFMTNNSSVGPVEYLDKLRRLGLKVQPRHIISSAEATCLMLADLGLGPDIYVLGTRAFRDYLAGRGYHHAAEDPAAVLVGFDTELTYAKLTAATRLVGHGVPLVASHPDVFCPTTDGPLPDAGALLAGIKAVTGVKPRAIAGKPYRWIVHLACHNFGLRPGQIVIVGDRLATDMRMARRFRMGSILTLTGATSREQLTQSAWQPDVVVQRLADLAEGTQLERLGWL